MGARQLPVVRPLCRDYFGNGISGPTSCEDGDASEMSPVLAVRDIESVLGTVFPFEAQPNLCREYCHLRRNYEHSRKSNQ